MRGNPRRRSASISVAPSCRQPFPCVKPPRQRAGKPAMSGQIHAYRPLAKSDTCTQKPRHEGLHCLRHRRSTAERPQRLYHQRAVPGMQTGRCWHWPETVLSNGHLHHSGDGGEIWRRRCHHRRRRHRQREAVGFLSTSNAGGRGSSEDAVRVSHPFPAYDGRTFGIINWSGRVPNFGGFETGLSLARADRAAAEIRAPPHQPSRYIDRTPRVDNALHSALPDGRPQLVAVSSAYLQTQPLDVAWVGPQARAGGPRTCDGRMTVAELRSSPAGRSPACSTSPERWP